MKIYRWKKISFLTSFLLFLWTIINNITVMLKQKSKLTSMEETFYVKASTPSTSDYKDFISNVFLGNEVMDENATVYDKLLRVTRHVVKPLTYEELQISLKVLLQKRRCNSFPCKQHLEGESQQPFRTRKEMVDETCKVLGSHVPLRTGISANLTLTVKNDTFKICTIPKVASRSWKYTLNFIGTLPLTKKKKYTESVITVRHPLDRLAAVYRDKFLNGQSISSYNEEWRIKTGNKQGWASRWSNYWLPAIVSSRDIIPNDKYLSYLSEVNTYYVHFLKSVEKYPFFFEASYRKDFIRHLENAMNKKKTSMLGLARLEFVNDMSMTLLNIMFFFGNCQAWSFFSNYGYTKAEKLKLQYKLSNYKFTFLQFLEHVIWTYEVGLEDYNWMSQQATCDICNKNYDVIFNHDNLDIEVFLYFKHLGYPEGTEFQYANNLPKPDDYDQRNKESRHSRLYDYDKSNYEGIPKEIIAKLRRIYFTDFLLFGFAIP